MVYLTTKPQPAKTKLENSPEMKKLLTEIKSYNSLVDGPLAKILDSTSKSWPPPKGKLMTSDVLWFINLSSSASFLWAAIVSAAWGIGVSFMSLVSLAYFLFPRFILGLYTSDPAGLATGTALLAVA